MADKISPQSLEEFFSEAVVSALVKEKVEASVWTLSYLVKLLSRADDIALHQDAPLSVIFVEALRAPQCENKAGFQRVGDLALCSSGLWWQREFAPRRVSNARLYIDLGRIAYSRIGGTPYAELADKFEGLVDALMRLGMEHSLQTARDIMQLYRLWQETHSRHAARVLAEKGLLIGTQEPKTPS